MVRIKVTKEKGIRIRKIKKGRKVRAMTSTTGRNRWEIDVDSKVGTISFNLYGKNLKGRIFVSIWKFSKS
jgi:hypothetical protein